MNEKAREARRAYKKAWREKNHEKIQEYNRKWREQNRDHLKVYQKQWRDENPDRIKQHYDGFWERKAGGVGALPETAPKRAPKTSPRPTPQKTPPKQVLETTPPGYARCLHCEDPFLLKRSDAKFCSVRCRVANNRKKQK